MAITAPSSHAPPDQPPSGPGRPARAADRALGRRRALPGSRAVVGGLLVTLAAIGTFVAATSAGSGPGATVVVVTRPIAIGDRLVVSDLRTVDADLPPEVEATLFPSVSSLDGAVALVPLAPDQAVARTDVSLAPSADGSRAHDLSFALDRDRALNGRIRPGELVDLVATFGSGTEARTEVVVHDVRVADLDAPSGSAAGAAAKVTVTLAFETEDDVLLAANALEVAKVTLSRSTGTTDRASGPAGPPEPTDAPPTGPGTTAAPASPSSAAATGATDDVEAAP